MLCFRCHFLAFLCIRNQLFPNLVLCRLGDPTLPPWQTLADPGTIRLGILFWKIFRHCGRTCACLLSCLPFTKFVVRIWTSRHEPQINELLTLGWNINMSGLSKRRVEISRPIHVEINRPWHLEFNESRQSMRFLTWLWRPKATTTV